MISSKDLPGSTKNNRLIDDLFGSGSDYESMEVGKIIFSKINKYENFWEILKNLETHIINIA